MNDVTQSETGLQDSRREIVLRPTAPIVPASNIAGSSLMLVISIMSFLACLTLGAVIMVQDTASSWQSQISREITIQIKPEPGLDLDAELTKARDIALSFTGTTAAKIVDAAATARLLEPWLGEGLDMEELPVPRLVIVTINESSPPDFAGMRAALEESVANVFLDDHRTWVDRLIAMANTTVIIGLGVLALVFTATILTVVFATRGALSGNHHIVEVLHFVGAEASFVASKFQKHFFLIALKGALAGGLGATLCFAVASLWASVSLATPESDQATALFGGFSMGAGGYIGALAIVVITAVLTALTTRITVIRTIAEIDLIRSDPTYSI